MKKKIRIIDKKSGKTFEKEVNVRNQDHFITQLTTRTHVFRDRKLYNRKVKHKKVEVDD